MYALIIGIDEYPSIRKLSGAVADAHAFRDFLIKQLSCSPNRIRLLLNEAATRESIIDAIREFSRNSQYSFGSSFVIYFAGHGTSTVVPPGWIGERMGTNIPMICPYDTFKKDANGQLIQPIPGRTIGALLTELATSKDDIIVRIVSVSPVL
jgi:hypothetical protein